jgi:hypothetical protein
MSENGRADGGPSSPAAWIDRLSDLPAAFLLPVAMLVFLILAAPAVMGDSATFDEGIHLSSGWTALVRRDFRLSNDNPPLAKVFAALPLAAIDVRWPEDPSAWDEGRRHTFDSLWLYHSGNDPDLLLRSARFANLFWSLLLLGAVYAVARERFGPRAGLVALVLAAVCPVLLGLGHLVTVDAAGAALFFLAVAAFLGFRTSPSLLRAAAAGILLGGALATKHSNLLLLPAFAVLAALEIRRERPWLRRAAPGLAVAAVATLAVVWGAFGFRYAGTNDGAYSIPWDFVEGQSGAVSTAVDLARAGRLLPEAYLHGIKLVQKWNLQGHPGYALGLHSETGWWWYFPLAFLVKTPLPTLALLAAGVWGWRRRRDAAGSDAFLWLPPLLFFGVAMTQSLNIGLRHILPVYPFVFVVAGSAAALAPAAAGALGRRMAEVGLPLAVLGCVGEAPHYLAHFNWPSTAFFERHELLADSNLDWGQDLARLKRYLDSRAHRNVSMAYFGAASPRHLGLQHRVLPAAHSYVSYEREWPPAPDPAPGDLVAVSASAFVGVGQEDPDRYRRLLGDLRPVATIGRSILIFRWEPPAAAR